MPLMELPEEESCEMFMPPPAARGCK
jgi:hypothetical protein